MAKLTYTPLGGAGEIGMNMYVYGYGPESRRHYIVVDAGVTFSNMETSPGIGLILPDYSWLQTIESRIEGIFLTHGHQDHVGAIGHVARDLDVPIHATKFGKMIAAPRLENMGLPKSRITTCELWPESIEAGPFSVSYLPISHSIPEACGLVIDTPAGRIIHSGDFKIDEDPVIGNGFDRAMWESASMDGVAALMCDSTNATSEGSTASESSLGNPLEALFRECSGMIVATTFASHVARLNQIARTAERCGRSVALLGRAMNSTIEAAVETGIIEQFPNLIRLEQARKMPRGEVCLLATGSQGEPRSSVSVLSTGKSYRKMKIMPGDTVLFSSKTIPGNELAVGRVLNNLARCGAHVIDDTASIYHVSGHPNRDDLSTLHDVVKPYLVVPVHGEVRHLSAHAKLAKSRGYNAMVVENGTTIDLLQQKVLDFEESGSRYYIDGRAVKTANGSFIGKRLVMAREGHVAVSVVVRKGQLNGDGIVFNVSGLPGQVVEGLDSEYAAELAEYINELGSRVIRIDDELRTELVNVLAQRCRNEFDKRPLIVVALHRIN